MSKKVLISVDGKWTWVEPNDPRRLAQKPRKDMRSGFVRPLTSQAAGCLPSQAAEFNSKAADGVHYNPETGNPEFASRHARNEEMKRRGLFDQDAGYGDHAGE